MTAIRNFLTATLVILGTVVAVVGPTLSGMLLLDGVARGSWTEVGAGFAVALAAACVLAMAIWGKFRPS